MTCNDAFGLAPAPDGLTGALMALEGVQEAAVILHGPTGCRGYHAALSEFWFPRAEPHEPMNFTERFYFGQARIPTTYLDQDDFVFGGTAKLREAVVEVCRRAPGLLAVVNAPGAALIGDDLRACINGLPEALPVVLIEMPSVGRTMAEGFSEAGLALLESLGLREAGRESRTVVLLGISIAHAHWEGSIAEIRRLLGLCGIEVICAPCAGSTLAELRRVPAAACAAVVHAEYGQAMAQWLQRNFGMPVIDAGCPIGFAATEQWIRAVAGALDVDASPALADILRSRKHIARRLYRLELFQELLRGRRFSIDADASLALPLTAWLYEYLGMIPASVCTGQADTEPGAQRMQRYLSSISRPEAWRKPWEECGADVLFADGPTAGLARARRLVGAAIELTLPSDDYIDMVPKALLGGAGAAYLVERIVNGIEEH